MRILPARQRRQRQRQQTGFPGHASSFTSGSTRQQPSDPVEASSEKIMFTGIAPGWLVDPSGRHEQRYWSGSEWTEHVIDHGVPGTDPPPPGAGRD
jgi:hypothetical protein